MKAVYVLNVGEAEVLTYGEQPEPARAGPREMMVRVRATALNRRDVFAREGSHGSRPARLPYIPGMEYAGDVVEVGPEVTRFKPGDRVFGTASGTYAELVLAPRETAEPIPEGLSYEEAAALPVAFCTAWHLLHCKGSLRTGEDVLVMAGGSGIGSAAIQLCRAAGARVLTTASTDAKLEKARALGADEGINYRELPNFAPRVRELTGGQGVDLVFEHIGTPVWENCFASLKRGGRLITCGVTAGHLVTLHLGQLWTRDLTIIGTAEQPPEDMWMVARLAGRGVIHGVVDSVLPLAEAAEAHRRMEASDFFGKIVLRVP